MGRSRERSTTPLRMWEEPRRVRLQKLDGKSKLTAAEEDEDEESEGNFGNSNVEMKNINIK